MRPCSFAAWLASGLLITAGVLAADEIPFAVRTQRVPNMRDGTSGATVTFLPVGPEGSRVAAGRVTLTSATDDTGHSLTQETMHKFYSISVGRLDDSKDLTSREPTVLQIQGLAKDAAFIRSAEGTLEIVIPDRDPQSFAVADSIATRYGKPIVFPNLEKAHVKVVVYDKASAEAMAKADQSDGPQHYDGGNMFGPPPPGLPSWEVAGGRPSVMEDNDIAVGISDPESRLLSVEFQERDGRAIHYNHGGRYHSSEPMGHPELRFDVYHLDSPLPPEARAVLLVMTEKSLLSAPLHLANIPLPAPGTGARDAGVVTCVFDESRDQAMAAIKYVEESGRIDRLPPAPSGLQEKLLTLWGDRPGYVDVLRRNRRLDALPRLLSSAPPQFPPVPPLFPNKTISVLVSFFIGEDGAVEDARAAESDNPRFSEAAVEAVLKWKFMAATADGRPAESVMAVPILFQSFTLSPAGSKPVP
jgi:TonB family protein